MKKRITAYLLAFALLCASIPSAFAVQTEVRPDANRFVTRAGVSGTVYQAKVYSQAEHEAQLKNATFTTIACSKNYAQNDGSVSKNAAEMTTDNFSSYGEQLPNYYYNFGKKSIYVGSAMKKRVPAVPSSAMTTPANKSWALRFPFRSVRSSASARMTIIRCCTISQWI